MDDDEADQPPPTVLLMINSWQATLMLGLVTIVFGVIVTAHPNGSLRVLAILIGIAAIVSGIFHLIRAADRAAHASPLAGHLPAWSSSRWAWY